MEQLEHDFKNENTIDEAIPSELQEDIKIDETKLTSEQKQMLENFKQQQGVKVSRDIIQKWYEKAGQTNIDNYMDFFKEIIESEQDAYSIADAMACVALGAVHAFNEHPNGKLDRRHTSIIGLRFYAHINNIQSPFRIMDYESLLDPNCDADYFSIPKQVYVWLRSRAKELFETDTDAPTSLRKRWKQIMNGKLPDGWVVREDKQNS